MCSLPLRRWLAASCALCLGASNGSGADAAFSADGKEVCLLKYVDQGERELRIGPSPATARKAQLPPAVAWKQVVAVGASAEDGWLLLTGDDVWRRPPGKEAFEHWLHCETTPKWNGLAVDPRSGNVLLSAAGHEETVLQLYVRAEKGLRNVRMRRVTRPGSFAFAPDGKLFFANHGDLWGGEIELEDYEDGGETRRIASLTAARMAPLADLETFNGTPASTGVSELAATRTHVFAHLTRMGGSGWGWIVRVPRPGKGLGSASGLEDYARYLRETSATLAASKVLGANERWSYLAAAPDGRVMYRLDKPDGIVLHRRPDGPAEAWNR